MLKLGLCRTTRHSKECFLIDWNVQSYLTAAGGVCCTEQHIHI